MSASKEDIIRDAAKDIINNFDIWEAEAHQQCQIDQCGDFYDAHMLECVTDVLARAFQLEALRTRPCDEQIHHSESDARIVRWRNEIRDAIRIISWHGRTTAIRKLEMLLGEKP